MPRRDQINRVYDFIKEYFSGTGMSVSNVWLRYKKALTSAAWSQCLCDPVAPAVLPVVAFAVRTQAMRVEKKNSSGELHKSAFDLVRCQNIFKTSKSPWGTRDYRVHKPHERGILCAFSIVQAGHSRTQQRSWLCITKALIIDKSAWILARSFPTSWRVEVS